MNDIVKVGKDKVISFDLLRVEKGRKKLCKCNPPHLELDTVNRIVTCADCGATLDAFEALMSLCNHMDKYREYQQEALKKCELYGKWADEEWNRRMKNKAFKDMDKQYHDGMLPHCPECGEVFEPMKISRWTNRKYCKKSETNNVQDK